MKVGEESEHERQIREKKEKRSRRKRIEKQRKMVALRNLKFNDDSSFSKSRILSTDQYQAYLTSHNYFIVQSMPNNENGYGICRRGLSISDQNSFIYSGDIESEYDEESGDIEFDSIRSSLNYEVSRKRCRQGHFDDKPGYTIFE